MSEKKTSNEVVFSAPASTSSTSSTPPAASTATGTSNGAPPSSTKTAVSSSAAARTPAAPVVPDPNDEEAISYVNQEGDWKSRKINLFRVVRGFVSQLKPGQDLTKVSLPAECCTPYGLLEVMGSRELAMFHLVFGMNRHPDDPMERFWCALRFFFGTVRSERFDKKPWNPVLGETHITYADVIYGSDGVGLTETVAGADKPGTASSSAKPSAASSSTSTGTKSRTVFVGEQVSHHPPVSAICLSNEREQLQCQANVSFSVKFGGNQVTVATAGELQIESKRFNERYELTKCLPDMVIRNVVWGKKYIMWEGEVTMTCPQTGITAFLKFKEKSSQNIVKGYIMRGDSDEPLFEINGVCGEKITYHSSSDPRKTEKLLLDLTTEASARIRYLPKSKLAPLSSVGVWGAVNKAVVDDDMTLADKEKKVIEQAQRERRLARVEAKQDFQGCYFDMSAEGMWTYKNNMNLDTVLAEGSHSFEAPPIIDDSDDSSDEEFVSQEEASAEPLLGEASSAPNASNALSDNDRSPITSGDEFEDGDLDGEGMRSPITMSSSNLDVSSPKRRRGSTSGTKHKPSLSSSSAQLPTSNSKKELRAEKKKAREEVKLVVTKMKEEKKKGTVATQLLEGQVYAGWCKVRNMMKKWKDRYLVVLPGRLVIFRSPKEAANSNASGLITLQGCDVRPRPSKKDGACFKIFSLNQYPIYSRQGLKGETISSALLPVGSDYLILRCADPTYMNVWIEKIRLCIPDWEKNKSLIKSHGLDLEDSDSDDDSIDDSEADIIPPASPNSSTLPVVATPANPMDVSGSSAVKGDRAITSEDILGQIGQLYKITRKVAQRQRKQMESLEEVKTKQAETAETLKKSAPALAPAAARRNPFEKKHSDIQAAAHVEAPAGIVGKIKAQLDPKTIALLLIIVYLLYLVFTAPSAASIAASASTATGSTASATKAAASKH